MYDNCSKCRAVLTDFLDTVIELFYVNRNKQGLKRMLFNRTLFYVKIWKLKHEKINECISFSAFPAVGLSTDASMAATPRLRPPHRGRPSTSTILNSLMTNPTQPASTPIPVYRVTPAQKALPFGEHRYGIHIIVQQFKMLFHYCCCCCCCCLMVMLALEIFV